MALLDIVTGNAAVAVVELSRGNSGTISDIGANSGVLPPKTCVEISRGDIGVLTDISSQGMPTNVELILPRSGFAGMNRGLS